MTQPPDLPIRLGISTCLLGDRVRYDGGHKRDEFIVDVLGKHVEWVPVCPELEVGMGVPREPVRLVGDPAAPRMVGVKSGDDWTARMREWCERRAQELAALRLSGYVFKARSPSCGMERVRVYEKGMPSGTGRGLYADAFLRRFPLVPAEEEGRLHDPALRESFIERVFAYHRLLGLRERFSRGALVRFHTAHKYLLLAHSRKHYGELGRLVARPGELSPAELRDRYSRVFMEALQVRATPRKHADVLQHIVGFLRPHLDDEDRRAVLAAIDDHRRGLTPLVVPVTLIAHFVRKHDVAYIRDQVYLSPHPKELMLRNRV